MKGFLNKKVEGLFGFKKWIRFFYEVDAHKGQMLEAKDDQPTTQRNDLVPLGRVVEVKKAPQEKERLVIKTDTGELYEFKAASESDVDAWVSHVEVSIKIYLEKKQKDKESIHTRIKLRLAEQQRMTDEKYITGSVDAYTAKVQQHKMAEHQHALDPTVQFKASLFKQGDLQVKTLESAIFVDRWVKVEPVLNRIVVSKDEFDQPEFLIPVRSILNVKRADPKLGTDRFVIASAVLGEIHFRANNDFNAIAWVRCIVAVCKHNRQEMRLQAAAGASGTPLNLPHGMSVGGGSLGGRNPSVPRRKGTSGTGRDDNLDEFEDDEKGGDMESAASTPNKPQLPRQPSGTASGSGSGPPTPRSKGNPAAVQLQSLSQPPLAVPPLLPPSPGHGPVAYSSSSKPKAATPDIDGPPSPHQPVQID